MVLPVFTDLPLFIDQQVAHAVAVVLLIRLIVGQRLYGLHPARDRRDTVALCIQSRRKDQSQRNDKQVKVC